jgi:hypothetical protein
MPPSESFNPFFVATLGKRVYYANNNTSSAPYWTSTDPVNNVIFPAGLTGAALDINASVNLVGLGTRIYNMSNPTATAYDTTASTWAALASYPTAAHNTTAPVIASLTTNKIYKIGGSDPGGNTFPNVVAYDTSSATWQTTGLANHPFAVAGACGGELNGKIYVFGGFLDVGGSNFSTTVYTESTNSWQTLPATGNFQGICQTTIAAHWGSKFVVTDSSAGTLLNFDFGTQKWSPTALPVAGMTLVAVATSDGLFVMGYDTAQGKIVFYKWMLE